MSLVAVGLNYASARLEFRERVSVNGYELDAALALLKASVREGFVLSTCNRTEVYAVLERGVGAEVLFEFLGEWGEVSSHDVRDVAYVHEAADSVRHAMRVASGLDSMVLGEDQIQAQMKRALAVARRAEAIGPTFERLGSAALACGKRVRTFTAVGRHAVSLESLAVRAAADRVGPLESRTIVIIGAGESASLVARQVKKAGAERVTIVSRSSERSGVLALAVDAQPGTLADLSEALSSADVVFACTSAPHPVLTTDFLAHRAALRPDAPLVCVDLGMPRDVDPLVGMIPGVTVVTLDELSTGADAHRKSRRADVPAAEAIVDGEVARFLEWFQARSATAEIAAIDVHGSSVAENELARALARLPALGPREREIVAEMAHRIARKLVHPAIRAVKQLPETTSPESEKIALG